MRKFRVIVNGSTYEVDIEEITDGGGGAKALSRHAAPEPVASPASATAAPVRKSAAPAPSENSGGGSVVAQMPGTIVAIRVSEGEEVKRGQTLVILEAMKMENEVVAPHDGTVLELKVEKDGSVNAGDVLVILE
jgi:biotin carboxyl carrier protein